MIQIYYGVRNRFHIEEICLDGSLGVPINQQFYLNTIELIFISYSLLGENRLQYDYKVMNHTHEALSLTMETYEAMDMFVNFHMHGYVGGQNHDHHLVYYTFNLFSKYFEVSINSYFNPNSLRFIKLAIVPLSSNCTTNVVATFSSSSVTVIMGDGRRLEL